MNNNDLRVREQVNRLRPYSPGKPIEELKRELGLEQIIKLASNENAFGPSMLAVQAVTGALAETNRYPDSSCFTLKQRLAARLGVGENQIIVGNGSDGLLKLIAETFVSPGDEVVMPHPSFVQYEFVGTLMGGRCVSVPLSEDLWLDLGAMLEHISSRTRLVFICNPNNPTGTAVSREALAWFLDNLPPGPITVIDEAYLEYADSDEVADGLDFVRRGDRIIVLRTFSKVHGLAGLRIGYGVSTPEIIEVIGRTREPFQVNRLAQVAAEAALDDQEHIDRCRRLNLQEKEYLYRGFRRLGIRFIPSQANFILIEVPGRGVDHFENMLRDGVIVRPGEPIGVPGYLRVTVGTREENERFLGSLEKSLALYAAQVS